VVVVMYIVRPVVHGTTKHRVIVLPVENIFVDFHCTIIDHVVVSMVAHRIIVIRCVGDIEHVKLVPVLNVVVVVKKTRNTLNVVHVDIMTA
jgi:hypothetical protein